MGLSDTAIARALLEKQLITEPQMDIWYRAVQLKEPMRSIRKDYPEECRQKLYRWRDRSTTLIEEVQDLDRRIEEERHNLPATEEPLRFGITVASGAHAWQVDDTTARRAVQRA